MDAVRQGEIVGVAQVSVTARDLERAVEFYRDVLGLPLLFQVPGAAFLDCGGVRLMLALPERAEFDHPASILYYRVGDVHETFALLKQRGTVAEKEPHVIGRMGDQEIWMAFLRDSEENLFAISGEGRV
jgi:catechol 2,3-dioxygenase-like lactoylglutathione lyase family enzyme